MIIASEKIASRDSLQSAEKIGGYAIRPRQRDTDFDHVDDGIDLEKDTDSNIYGSTAHLSLKEKLLLFLSQRYRVDRRTAILVACLVLAFAFSYYLMNVMANVASFRSKSIANPRPLPDAMHDVLLEIHQLDLTDVFDFAMLVPTVAWILISPEPVFVFAHVLTAWGITNFMRSTTMAVTSLPDPRNGCEFVESDLLTTFTLHRCGDCIFSGHTIIFVVSALVWTTYPPRLHRHIPGLITFNNLLRSAFSGSKQWQPLTSEMGGEAQERDVDALLARGRSRLGHVIQIVFAVAMWLLAIVAALVVLANRAHYTVDVLLSFYITVANWYAVSALWTNIVKPSRRFPMLNQMHARLNCHHRRDQPSSISLAKSSAFPMVDVRRTVSALSTDRILDPYFIERPIAIEVTAVADDGSDSLQRRTANSSPLASPTTSKPVSSMS